MITKYKIAGSLAGLVFSLAIPLALKAQQSNDTLNFKQNFGRTWRPKIPLKTTAGVVSLSRTSAEMEQSTSIFDAFGRVIQNIGRRQSPQGKDVVVLTGYDSLGRPANDYLPYISSGSTGDAQSSALSAQGSFYNSYFSGENTPYSQTGYERSPLGTEIKKMAPGRNWGGASRGTTTQYLSNTVADSVRIWLMNGNSPVSSARYSPGELMEVLITDEQGRKTITYTDRLGHEVLRKIQVAPTPGNGHMGWQCNYKVYDDLGFLRFEISPLAVSRIVGSWNISTVLNLCTRYRYDQRGRLIVRENPDGDSTEYVFDRRGRTVFTRDGNLRAQNKWLANFYDSRDRKTMVAIFSTPYTRAQLQPNLISGSASATLNYTVPGKEDLETAVNDTDTYRAGTSITFLPGFETSNAQEMTAEISPVSGETVSILADNPYPGILASQLSPLMYIYYDDYSFPGAQAARTADFAKPRAGSDPYPERPTAVSKLTEGLVTGRKIRILGTEQWLTSTEYYDDKARTVQSITENESGGTDILTSLFNFSGQLIGTYYRHGNKRSGLTPVTTISTAMTYEPSGKIIKVAKEINDDGNLKNIAQLRYNELGKISTSVLGASIDSLEMDYNIRGWLKNINKGYAVNGASDGKNHKFGLQLFYDSTYTAQYTGNLAGTRWRGFNDNAFRSYGFAYDAAHRMLKADFTQYTSGSWNTSAGIDFSMKMGDGLTADSAYDLNGNILAMSQKGLKGGSSVTIDNLRYSYQTNSNRLQGVRDIANDPSSTAGDFKEVNGSGDNDYAHDLSGNMIRDANKGITSISYNHLNQPEIIKVRGKGVVTYRYDATGNCLKEIVVDSTSAQVRTIITDYIGGFQYQNDSLQFFGHEEGRVRMVYASGSAPTRAYDYFIKDYRGDVRTVLTEQTNFSMYSATMEPESAPEESQTFSNIEETRTANPVGYPQRDTAHAFVARLSAKEGAKKIGPATIIRVNAGDSIKISAKAFYKSEGPDEQEGPQPTAEEMITSLAGIFGDAAALSNVHGSGQAGEGGSFTENFYRNHFQRMRESEPGMPVLGRRRSFLNFVLFDDQMKLVPANSGVRQVKNSPDELQLLEVEQTVTEKSGFLVVFPSNESPQDVFYDDIIVTDISGPVLEETHYYPWGLVMDGISTRTPLSLENRTLYQGKQLQRGEFADGTGLEWYRFPARYYDQQTGRWISVDPASQDFSGYMAMGNRPMISVDPDGRIWHILIGGAIGGFINVGLMWKHLDGFNDGVTAFGIGFAAGALATATGGAALGVATGVGASAGVSGVGVAAGAGGFWTGVGTGIISGGVSGAIQGTGNAIAFQEMDTKQALEEGAKSGLGGMIFGGVFGGLTNGIIADINGRNFWNGNLRLTDIKPVVTAPTPTLKTYTYDENLARTDIHSDWKLGPAPRGVKLESEYSRTIYAGYQHTPYAKTYDFNNGIEVVSMKTSMSETLKVTQNLKELSNLPFQVKTLHIVTPPGHIPSNMNQILDLARQLQINVTLTHY